MWLQKHYIKQFFFASLNDKTQINDRCERKDISYEVYLILLNEPNIMHLWYYPVRYWIDYTDIGKEGCWLTFSSGKDEYSSWYSKRPDGGRIQNCATNNYLSQLGQWDDVGCYNRYPPLCETSGKICHKSWGVGQCL